ncbi:MAG: hypothetical protein N3B11_08130, partial [Coriobacteriia bacterium]|nr:hypothetical protein [Coriobacteriia bacterium]
MPLTPEARRDVGRELKSLPQDKRGYALLMLAQNLAEQGRYAAAADVLDLASAELAGLDDAAAAVARIDAAALLARSGRPMAALQSLRGEFDTVPSACRPRALFTLGCVLATLDEHAEAQRAFVQAADEHGLLGDAAVERDTWRAARLECLLNAALCSAEPPRALLDRIATIAKELEELGGPGLAIHARVAMLGLRLSIADGLPPKERRAACRTIASETQTVREMLSSERNHLPSDVALALDLMYARSHAECGGGREARRVLAELAPRLEARGDAWRAALALSELAVLEHTALAGRRDLAQAEMYYRQALDQLETALYGHDIDELRVESRRERMPDPASGLCRLWVQQHGMRDQRIGDSWLLTSTDVLHDVLTIAERGRSAVLRAELGGDSSAEPAAPVDAGEIVSLLEPDEALIAYMLTHDDRKKGLLTVAADATGIRWASYRPGAGTVALELTAGLRAEIAAAERAEFPDGSPWIAEDSAWD